MHVDRYTRFVLTVIAAALLWLCAMNSGLRLSAQQFGPATAQMVARVPAQPVVIVGWGSISSQGEVALSLIRESSGVVRTDNELAVRLAHTPTEGIPVKLNYTPQEPLPVGITGIVPAAGWEPIRVKVEPQPSQPFPGPPQ